ncbi:MAG: hypothetical protein QOI56_1310, partial [Actinomycetota bacterium]|nr:hypothetical protein [Actinomycetota bacterium]
MFVANDNTGDPRQAGATILHADLDAFYA